ncbi:MAG: GNAT family N-acetyltransferase [candidate division Zixibacteria bacterium]|nr:GNAT family N-acetyltransferase [candidate division Zixibacteria bacterium]
MTEKNIILDTPPSLIGDKIYLRPATDKDIANTYHWFILSEPSAQSCRPHPFLSAAEAAESFKKKEKSTDQQRFVIVRLKDKVPVGIVNFFNMNHLNRSVEFGILIDPDEQRHGFAAEATRLLCNFLYNYRGVNKIYAQTAAFNKGAVKLLEKTGFKQDGILRQHYYYDGEFYDGYIYSQLRFEFEW